MTRLSFRCSALLLILAVPWTQSACSASRSLPNAASAGHGASGEAGAAAGAPGAAGLGVRAGEAGAAGRVGGSAGTVPPVSCSASAPPLGPATLARGIEGKPYLQVLTVVGVSSSQLHWAITRGQLPGGLSLVPTSDTTNVSPVRAQAELRGTPITAGTFEFTVQGSVLGTFPCGAAPAIRSYALVVDTDSDEDAGVPGGKPECGESRGSCVLDVLAATVDTIYEYASLEQKVAALPQTSLVSLTEADIASMAAEPASASRIELLLTVEASSLHGSVLERAQRHPFRLSCGGESLFVGVVYEQNGAAGLRTPVLHVARAADDRVLLRLGAWQGAWLGLISLGDAAAKSRIDRPEFRAPFCQRGAIRELSSP